MDVSFHWIRLQKRPVPASLGYGTIYTYLFMRSVATAVDYVQMYLLNDCTDFNEGLYFYVFFFVFLTAPMRLEISLGQTMGLEVDY